MTAVRTTKKQQVLKNQLCTSFKLQVWYIPLPLLSACLDYRAGSSYALFPHKLALCLHEKIGWLAYPDLDSSNQDLDKRAGPSSHINTTQIL